MSIASLHPAPAVSPPAAAPASDAIDWRDVPVFIVNRNRLGALRELVDWLCAAGTRRVVIMDNASDYPPLLAYYEQLPSSVKVMRLPENHGPYVVWQQGVHKVLDTPYVVTDSDVVPAGFCPQDLIGALLSTLQRFPEARKVGAALRIDNLPDSYGEADTVRKWESQFWEHPVAPGVFAAPVDTTFAIYPAFGEFSNDTGNLRLGHPYIAEHTPWYVDEAALSAEERYYRDHTSATFSNWSVASKDSWVRRSERVASFEQRAQVLHIDGGREYIPGWINAGDDSGNAAARFDIGFDAARAREQRLPLGDNSLDGIHLSHVLEGVRDAQALFDELYRVAKPNAKLFIRVAYGARDGAWQDPAQQRAWTEGSFAHFGQPSQPSSSTYRADWRLESVQLSIAAGDPQAAPAAHDDRQPIDELVVTLRAVKPGRPRSNMHPVPQVDPVVARDGRIDPAFETLPNHPVAVPQPIRLGLPWRLPHYAALNGPHPLVQSFVRDNPAVERVEIDPTASVSRAQQQAVLLQMTQDARKITHEATGAFYDSLNLQDQLVIEAQAPRCDALFLHTTPLYAGSQPWIFHFESFPSLFMPFMYTGRTTGIDLTTQGFFKMVRDTLESPRCLRIFSHMRGSLEILNRSFDSPLIAAKCQHVPLGIPALDDRLVTSKFDTSDRLRILFTNSLHQEPGSFYLRGGHHLLEAFARLRKRLPDIELTVLSSVPPDLLQRFAPERLVGVNWINTRVDDAMLERLYLDHHLFALPAAGLHSFSLLRALAHGCVPIVSDAPGYEEYTRGIEHSTLTICGVREMVYRDETSGWISDDYAPFIESSESFVQQIHDRVLEHAALPRLREMALLNLAHCRRQFSVEASQAAFNRLLPLP
jgi:glycosyltransferase involved in cell wall biosynthesis